MTDATQLPKGFKPISSTYGYDNNGNIVSDDGKGLTIACNVLNLPQLVTGATGTIKFDHTFSGEQIKKTVDIGGTTETRLYIGGVEFVDGVPETYYHPDGRIFFKEGVPKFQYKIVDHLGNTAVLFEDIDGAGLITMEDPITGISPEVHQRQFYYSFGMAMEGGWKPQSDPEHQYLYNGKELHEDLGLGWYAYGFRFYDATIGRFPSVDPLADKYPYYTTYQYAGNIPIRYLDLDGLEPFLFTLQHIVPWGVNKFSEWKSDINIGTSNLVEGSAKRNTVINSVPITQESKNNLHKVQAIAGSAQIIKPTTEVTKYIFDAALVVTGTSEAKIGTEIYLGVAVPKVVSSATAAKVGFKVEGQLAQIFGDKRLFSNWLKGNNSLSRVGNPLNTTEAQQIINNAKNLGLPVESNLKGLQGLEITGQWGGIPHFKVGNVHIPIEKGLDGVLKF